MRAGTSFSCGGNNESDGMAADAWMSISETLNCRETSQTGPKCLNLSVGLLL